jgi:CheY-like chemotaxis protein
VCQNRDTSGSAPSGATEGARTVAGLSVSGHTPDTVRVSAVLVIDDDPDVRRLLAAYLEVEGFTVSTAANGSEALHQLHASAPPNVILLDLMMPVMDGAQFRREQQSTPALQHIPVVCVSAQHDASAVAARLGVHGCLTKPFDLEAVADAVRRCCAA